MTPKLKRTVLAAAASVLVFAALAGSSLWLIPPPHGRLEYMIAGTAATAITLVAVFARVVMRPEKCGSGHRRGGG